jgi:hypothetical protein
MDLRNAILPSLFGILASVSVPTASQAAEKRPIVIELFTSQGCSSCPPANANLIELGRREDVLTLSYAVTYWDYLGWKDIFGKQAFTDRQVTYEPALGERGPFTPQMVINGRTSTVGILLAEVESVLAYAAPADGPEIALRAGHATIGQGDAPAGGADVWLVRYNPEIVNVPVARGENKGRTLPHSHVVHDLVRLGRWHGKDVKLTLPSRAGALRSAILVQVPDGGPILAAVTD